jgi:hypothetical protein
VQRAGDMATLEGTLSTTENVLLATATAVASRPSWAERQRRPAPTLE